MSRIEWTTTTWNPVLGCSMARGSETGGCLHCYAARMAMRNLWPGEAYARMTKSGPRWTGKVELRPERLDAPLHWRKPRRVFVNSMSDLFHEDLPDEAIAAVFGVMAACQRHTFQVLTKRPERMRRWFEWARVFAPRSPYDSTPASVCVTALRQATDFEAAPDYRGADWPLPNVWLGVSVEDQKTADERIPLLLQTPAAVRFVSYEPALGAVDFGRFLLGSDGLPEGLSWLIVGGESGPGARPCDVAWIRSVVNQCREAGVKCFVKQMGANVSDSTLDGWWDGGWPKRTRFDWGDPKRTRFDWGDPMGDACSITLKDPKGGDPKEWPADLRVRELPR